MESCWLNASEVAFVLNETANRVWALMWPAVSETFSFQSDHTFIYMHFCVFIFHSKASIAWGVFSKHEAVTKAKLSIQKYYNLKPEAFKNIPLPLELLEFKLMLFDLCLLLCFYFANLLCFVWCWSCPLSTPVCLLQVTLCPIKCCSLSLVARKRNGREWQ